MTKKDSQETQNPAQPLGGSEYAAAIARSLAVIAMRMAPTRLKDQGPQILFLNAIGLDRNEIAGLLNTTPGTVSVTLSQKKIKSGKGKKRRGKKNKR